MELHQPPQQAPTRRGSLRGEADGSLEQLRWGEVAQLLREIQEVAPPHDRRVAWRMLFAAYIWGEAQVSEGLAYFATVRDQPGQTLRAAAILHAGESALLAASGQIERALELARQSTDMARDLDPRAVGASAFLTAQVHIARGDLTEAINNFTEGIEALRAEGVLAMVSTMLGWKAALLLEQGDHDDEARLVVEEAAVVTSPYHCMSVALVETCRAILAAREGDHAQAAARASEALAVIDTTDQLCQQADVRRWLSEVHRRRGDVAGQRRTARRSAGSVSRQGSPAAPRGNRATAVTGHQLRPPSTASGNG